MFVKSVQLCATQKTIKSAGTYAQKLGVNVLVELSVLRSANFALVVAIQEFLVTHWYIANFKIMKLSWNM